MLQENSRPSKLGGKTWLKETVSTNQLSIIWRDPKSLNVAPTLEEVTILTCIILFATTVINKFTTAVSKNTKITQKRENMNQCLVQLLSVLVCIYTKEWFCLQVNWHWLLNFTFFMALYSKSVWYDCFPLYNCSLLIC